MRGWRGVRAATRRNRRLLLAPFSCGAVGLDVGAIDRGRSDHTCTVGENLEHCQPAVTVPSLGSLSLAMQFVLLRTIPSSATNRYFHVRGVCEDILRSGTPNFA